GTFEYTPYGEPYRFKTAHDITRLYTGHHLDAVTGDYFAPFRYLDPSVGRWLKRDPLCMIDGTNMFGYVDGNPIKYMDLYGLEMSAFGASCATLCSAVAYRLAGNPWAAGAVGLTCYILCESLPKLRGAGSSCMRSPQPPPPLGFGGGGGSFLGGTSPFRM